MPIGALWRCARSRPISGDLRYEPARGSGDDAPANDPPGSWNFECAVGVSLGVNRRFTIVLVAALVLSGCTDDAASEFETITQSSTSGLDEATISRGDMTTMTTATADVGSITIDLLDGSELNVAGPAQLGLGGYFYFTEIRGLGETNVYLTRYVDPAEAAAVEDTEFHSDLGDGVKLWVGDREGQPFFMTVEMGDWVALVHVGWESPPETGFLLSLAEQLRGQASDRGVVIPNFDVDVFRTSLHDPDSEDSVQLWAGQCLQELVSGAEAVEHPDRGEMIRSSRYASWCEPEHDLEVTVSGTETFVDRVVETLTLIRTPPQAGRASGPISGRLPDGTRYEVEFDPPLTTLELSGPNAAIVLDLEDDPEARLRLGCVHQCRVVAIGVTTFAKTASPTSFEEGTFRISSGDWTMSIDLYENILDLWGDEAEKILTESITPVDVQDGLPAFLFEQPMRWGTDTELPLQMEVDYGSFVIRRGCGDLSVGCSPNGSVQVIPAQEVFAPAPQWNYDTTVTVTEPGP